MRKLKIILPLVFIIFTLAMPSVFASYNYSMVYDLDGSLTSNEEEVINDAIKKAANEHKMNIAIMITSDIKGKSAMSYADDYYDKLFGTNTDGILLLINNDTKKDWISTSGSAIKKYHDSDIQLMFDDITPKLQNDDFKGASLAFVDSLKNTHSSNYDWISAFGISFGISAIIVIIIGLLITSHYKLHKTISATNYVCDNKTQMHESRDDFIRQYVTKVKIVNDNNGGRGGFGGGSSTHRSRSGGRHGGGGRRR